MSPKSSATACSNTSPGRLLGSIGIVVFGVLLATSCCQTWLSSRNLATNFISPATWLAIVGGPAALSRGADVADVSFGSVLFVTATISLLTWVGGAAWISWRTGQRFVSSLASWGQFGGSWWCLLGFWEWTWIGAGVIGWTNVSSLLAAVPQFWLACCASGWITTLLCLGAISAEEPLTLTLSLTLSPQSRGEGTGGRTTLWLWLACGLYVAVFTTMNWRLYFNLLVPHGDSVMYEEHLWNVLHGKGFRSYLDQGLFLGEHIQFVHLFLLPLYLIWPSHLLLELCESSALALGAFPVFWMTLRHTKSDRTALAAAVAYLLYSPMQFLDIEIDLKTFRPEAFGIPLLLLALDQLERRSLVGTLMFLALTLTVKEDYAIVLAPLGLWIAGKASDFRLQTSDFRYETSNDKSLKSEAWSLRPDTVTPLIARWWQVVGVLLCLFSVIYLWLATRFVMPWFRSGVEVHYARYFAKFGETPEQIVRTMVTQPGLLFGELVTIPTILYALAMLAPLAFLPLFSPGRLAVGLPLFGILCLNELAKDPRHHFHAPLVAIVFWSVAGGLPRAAKFVNWIATRTGCCGEPSEQTMAVLLRTALWSSALTTGLFIGLSPLGVPFWDPGSTWSWQRLYGTSRRAELFARVVPQIPLNSRVASTDFVHPRFTHCGRSYDYSKYPRRVNNNQPGAPPDTDFIVIDTRHPYSEIKSPHDVPEYRDHSDQWELLPDDTDGYFIVLRRRR